MDSWDFKVGGYRKGQLLVETVHKGAASMEMEVAVWKDRMRKGECDLIVVADMRPKWRRDLEAASWRPDLSQRITHA